ncbi:MAG: hypothetical protein SAL07_23790 [Oscillatoria sp. PMC 1051.18]|uniref:hypothetical protein n=1 Tax=Oscillatoria salina TaxID=331517 RepID=UPI0013BACFD3|nr:hypothetical protein [Oscillatoria salina]MBZ8179792.1 hypothetical protein [Oscillatoria salina IIICB1]MEC4893020.1 hypothetical protein [Oscillatoria sp. PMC 1050.18]MEC5032935.1 hypothetical protein [Oscillatoria sp. PMC 1051.18]NET87697.1 hypothetical protein [Kamptonema sp. SIO1D9]
MKTISKWIAIGIIELIFCFWLLGKAANLVSSPSNLKVLSGVVCYLAGLLVIPGVSISYAAHQITDAKRRQKQLKQAFPDEETSVIQLLDLKK